MLINDLERLQRSLKPNKELTQELRFSINYLLEYSTFLIKDLESEGYYSFEILLLLGINNKDLKQLGAKTAEIKALSVLTQIDFNMQTNILKFLAKKT